MGDIRVGGGGVYGVCMYGWGDKNRKDLRGAVGVHPDERVWIRDPLFDWGDEEGVIASPRLGKCVRVFVQYPVELFPARSSFISLSMSGKQIAWYVARW